MAGPWKNSQGRHVFSPDLNPVLNKPASATSHKSNRRLHYLGAFLAFWFLAICVRLFWLQVVAYGDYSQRAARQQQRSLEVSAVRGNVYDRNGNTLAMTVNVDSVFAVPAEISNARQTAAALAKALNVDPTDIESRLHTGHAFAWVARKIDKEASARIHALKLKGIYFRKEAKRFYPNQELAAQVLGFVSLDDEGLGGLERQFDAELRGKPGRILVSMDEKRRGFARVEKEPEPGENVVLTLDENIQHIAERELKRAVGDTHAEAGTIIVMNPHTGEILALANLPVFNPNAVHSIDKPALEDRAVSDIYEPGSTFKIVTLAAAMEEKLTRPNEVIDCQMGSIDVNGLVIHDHRPYGLLTVSQVLENSSDVGAIKLALRLGNDRFDRYIRAFGFGSRTGIELPFETAGIARRASQWSKVSIGAVSMGQEIGVSPLQLISMASTIANDGAYVPPRLVAGVTPPRSTAQLITFHPADGRRVISTMTAAQMKRMMEGVVLGGTGKRAILDGYSSAGKTGTSQKFDKSLGRYSHRRHVASFAGFAPVNNSAVTVLVVLDGPAGAQDGGAVAAPVFARVTQQVLGYLGVPHDVEFQDPKRLQLRAQARDEDMAEGPADRVATEAEAPSIDSAPAAAPVQRNATLVPATYSPPPVPAAPAPARAAAPPRGTVVLDVGGGVAIPDFRGKPLRSCLEEAQSAGIELEVSGSGVAQSQSPASGSRVPPGGHVRVRFGH
ncbi:MAG TPA: penicillin-binding protein [Verrucomicrobiae bacterium]|jgi:cell division protein FtsI (penicillin-binding protein 3)|nr:penicillin-binding protein [Verrucomicrobiae bacterium]